MLYRWRLYILAVALSALAAGGAHAGAGRTGANILDLPHRSVRAAGMGEAFATYDGDVNSVLWNPAGLSTIRDTQILSGWNSFEKVFGEAGDGLYYFALAAAEPVGELGVLSAALQLNGQGTIDITTDSPEVKATEGLGTNWVASVSYAEELSPTLRAGLTGKIIHLPLGVGFEQASSATAYAIDGGVQADFYPVTLGASILNYGTRVQFKDAYQSDPLPRKFHGGVAITALDAPNTRLVISLEGVAAIDKLTQNREDEDFYETVNERLVQGQDDPTSDYVGMTRIEIEDELVKQRGAGIYAFGWDRLERGVGLELTLGRAFKVRAGYKKFDSASEPPQTLEHIDRVSFGFGVDGAEFGLPFVVDYANAIWGAGGPLLERVNSFSLSFRL
jgi:hypothetical protein